MIKERAKLQMQVFEYKYAALLKLLSQGLQYVSSAKDLYESRIDTIDRKFCLDEESQEKIMQDKRVNCNKKSLRYWSDEDQEAFMTALRKHGKDWFMISKYCPGRTISALKAHAHLLK